MEYDVIIIGGGPAGISASLYTVRANKKTLVLYDELSSLEKTRKLENYYGFPNGISGEALYKKGIEQAKKRGVYKGRAKKYAANSSNREGRLVYEGIKRDYQNNDYKTKAELARKYGVTRQQLYRIIDTF